MMKTIEATGNAEGDETEIRALMTAWARALEARDVDGLAAAYAPDIVLYDVKPPFRIDGVAAYRKVWEDCLPYFPKCFRSRHDGIEVRVSGDVAFAFGLHKVEPLDDEPWAGDSWIRVTVCLQRIDGAWRVVHEHVSIPFDPLSGQVVPIKDVQP